MTKPTYTSDLIEEARGNIESWFSYFAENITRAHDDVEFALGNQWDAESREHRQRNKKPTLQFNQLYAQVNAIIGEHRKNTPNICIHPASSQVNQHAIDLREGIIRQTFYDSKSDVVFQEAFKWTMYGGFAALRVITDYESNNSFNQIIKFSHIADPTRAFFDPSAEKPDKSDGRFCGVYEILSKEQFEQQYPEVKHTSSFTVTPGVDRFNWESEETITVAEYFVKEFFNKKLVQLNTGQALEAKKAEQLIQQSELAVIHGMLQQPLIITAERIVKDYKIMHYKLTGDTILEQTEWPSKELPVIFVDGDSFYRNGLQITKSFIHYAKDAQRYLNYVASESALAILNRRREDWLVTPQNIKGNEQIWRNPQRVQGALVATPDSRTGLMPQKVPPSEIPNTLTTQYQRAMEDIKHILGRYEANLGMPSNERSGIAITNRIKQGNASTMVYFDNLNRAVESCARVILSLIPTVLNSTRTLPIRTKEGKHQLIDVNQPSGETFENDLASEGFSVMVEAGPNYAVQKAEALEQLMQLAALNPKIAEVIPDLIGENFELENMPQIVERLKTLLPPAILAQEEGKPLPPPPPNPQALLAEKKLQIEHMKAENEAARIQLEKIKLGQDANVSHLKTQAELGKAQLSYNTALINHHQAAQKHAQPNPLLTQ